MSPFVEWKRSLHEEDILEFGGVVSRPDSAYNLLYNMYKKSQGVEDNEMNANIITEGDIKNYIYEKRVEIMSKYTALINEFDKDYRSYSGEIAISVSSWEEAEEWCKKGSWSGYGYSVHLLEDNNTCQVYWTKASMK